MINAHGLSKDSPEPARTSNEDLSSKEKEIEMEVTVTAINNEDPFDTTNDDLDPVALNKAFRFASVSSIALVSGFTHVVEYSNIYNL